MTENTFYWNTCLHLFQNCLILIKGCLVYQVQGLRSWSTFLIIYHDHGLYSFNFLWSYPVFNIIITIIYTIIVVYTWHSSLNSSLKCMLVTVVYIVKKVLTCHSSLYFVATVYTILLTTLVSYIYISHYNLYLPLKSIFV